MPIHEYLCKKCNLINEISLSIKENVPETIHCDECNGPAEHQLAAPVIIFKGWWPGQEVRHGDNYIERHKAREQDAARDQYIKSSEAEAKEIMKARRQGRKASAEHRKHNLSKWKRYSDNLKKGIGRNA
jgi:putative FmdB family regulatory protein